MEIPVSSHEFADRFDVKSIAKASTLKAARERVKIAASQVQIIEI